MSARRASAPTPVGACPRWSRRSRCCAALAASPPFFLYRLAATTMPSATALGCGRRSRSDLDGKLPRSASTARPDPQRGDHHQRRRGPEGAAARAGSSRSPPRCRSRGCATCRNLGSRNDHDSLGLFQQRPSQGWGTPRTGHGPGLRVPEVLREAAHGRRLGDRCRSPRPPSGCSVSAYPDAYAKHEPLATQIVNALAGGAAARSAVSGPAVRRGRPDRRLRLDRPGRGGPSAPVSAPHRPTPPGRRHRRAEGHADPRGGQPGRCPGAAATRTTAARLGLRRATAPRQGRLRLVRRHPARRRRHHPVLPHGAAPLVERRPDT